MSVPIRLREPVDSTVETRKINIAIKKQIKEEDSESIDQPRVLVFDTNPV
jgi:hypothetical protein